MKQEVTIHYLEMRDRASIRPGRAPQVEVRVERADTPCPALGRFLYTAVGGDWHWTDRLPWTWQQWLAYQTRDGVELWVAYAGGNAVGYFELERIGDDTELVYFGLLPQFVGLGLGGFLLTRALEQAWDTGASRVWVNTCTLDHPAAMTNYLARGLVKYDENKKIVDVAPEPIGPWPGARPQETHHDG